MRRLAILLSLLVVSGVGCSSNDWGESIVHLTWVMPAGVAPTELHYQMVASPYGKTQDKTIRFPASGMVIQIPAASSMLEINDLTALDSSGGVVAQAMPLPQTVQLEQSGEAEVRIEFLPVGFVP